MALALSPPIEATIQEMERRGAEASRKIDDAVKAIDESADVIADMNFDDPSVVQHIADLKRVTRRVRAATVTPPASGTPPEGSAPPVPARIARFVRSPRKPR
jgi:hypothetical protein